MARLTWLVIQLAFVAAILAGVSWIAAYTSVANLLGAPPPEMGTQTTNFLWHGLNALPGHPRVWRFAFAPTRIPGAPNVKIYVNPWGHTVLTEPEDLDERVKAFHHTGF
jgi:hypothetical protein